MFYQLLKNKVERWAYSNECTVRYIFDYIITTGKLRDAQIESIKTYLYIKIVLKNQSIKNIISNGELNFDNFADEPLTQKQREFFENNNISSALYNYGKILSTSKNEEDKISGQNLLGALKENYDAIDYDNIIQNLFSDYSYSEYIYSLPMGAGKTYLMACFIYLDLYFSELEPDNNLFAKNFLIIAPNGLKNSIIPSLKDIENFDPAFILPEPSASNIKRKIKFLALDSENAEAKQTRANNPNVQLLKLYEPLDRVEGLVLVVNAEKVILNKSTGLTAIEEYILQKENENNDSIDLEKVKKDLVYKKANELRKTIGEINNLSIFIDEVHHVADNEIKVRKVINYWNDEYKNILYTCGFSGTPYVDKKNILIDVDNKKITTSEMSNIVYYYPLIDGIDNFLKHPIVSISSSNNSEYIIKKGLKEFFENNEYNKTYDNGLTSKLVVYCGRVKRLNEEVYPIVLKEIQKYGLDETNILRYYGKIEKNDKNDVKEYALEKDAEIEFLSLDKPYSKKRVILLVGIGREGWDCKSLTGVILSQENDSNKKNVLQTCCRTLRQVIKYNNEKAIIVLNKFNADKFNEQLKSECNTNIDEIQSKNIKREKICRYDRRNFVDLDIPAFTYKNLSLKTIDKLILKTDTRKAIKEGLVLNEEVLNYDEDIKNEVQYNRDTKYILNEKRVLSYNDFVNDIVKTSFMQINYDLLINEYNTELLELYKKIILQEDKINYLKQEINYLKTIENVRKSFSDIYDVRNEEIFIKTDANLLIAEKLNNIEYVTNLEDYYPTQDVIEKIHNIDIGNAKLGEDIIEMISNCGAGITKDDIEKAMNKSIVGFQHINDTYHYIPYKMDSGFENKFLEELAGSEILRKKKLKIFYNGDDNLTDFKIMCYETINNNKECVGYYVPDFLIIHMNNKKIDKVLIAETKGEIYKTEKFKKKMEWTKNEFIKFNSDDSIKFDYLYIDDKKTEIERFDIAKNKINEFFKEA